MRFIAPPLPRASILLACLFPALALALPRPNSLFSDHTVLQRGVPLPVWGNADPGEQITVRLDGQTVSAATGRDGAWTVTLPAQQPGGPYTLTISGSGSVDIHDVYVGDVWVCSGQSNMERQLGPRPPQLPIDNWQQEAASANFPQIHEYFVPEKLASGISQDAMGQWETCTPDTAPKFSAVSFFFARALYQDIKVPLGLLFTSWGGTTAESWVSDEALKANPQLASIVAEHEKYAAAYPAALAAYQQSVAALKKKYDSDATAAGQPALPPFKAPRGPNPPASSAPSRLYNAMVAPLIRFPIRGAIWYQGESNGGRGFQYRTLFPALIADWRARWHVGDFPFLFVQIAPYRANDPMVREAQLLTMLHTPNTAMAVTTDVGDATNIHPTHKRPVGERLALAARALSYGEKIEYSGPLIDSAKVAGGGIGVTFTHADGLAFQGGAPRDFQVAGADLKFVDAAAAISGSTVKVSSPAVPSPMYVRYGWTQVPTGNLVNAAGLPASPFRTDGQ